MKGDYKHPRQPIVFDERQGNVASAASPKADSDRRLDHFYGEGDPREPLPRGAVLCLELSRSLFDDEDTILVPGLGGAKLHPALPCANQGLEAWIQDLPLYRLLLADSTGNNHPGS